MRLSRTYIRTLSAGVCLAALTWVAAAQSAVNEQPADERPADLGAVPPTTPPELAALPLPAFSGTLQQVPPAIVNTGLFGKIAVNGFLAGIGFAQSNPASGDERAHGAPSNGELFIQKTDGWFQFFLEAGAYNLPALGVPFAATNNTVTDFYGLAPVAFLKFQAAKNTSFLIGSLPTLIGAEYTFTFQNMNIERGLLWYQEPAVSRGVQVNQIMGKLTASLSWNDGFYSRRYTWLSGSLTYANGPHSLAFVAGGNYGSTVFQTPATPVQNNGSIYNIIYTYTKGRWIVQPYYQFTSVPTNASIGIVKGASTNGGAVLVSRAFKHGFSLPARCEYIASSGSARENAVNLMFGPGSTASSITATPTFQHGPFFFRGDVAFVHAGGFTPGAAFGPLGLQPNQTRVAGEIGFVFGNNLNPEKRL